MSLDVKIVEDVNWWDLPLEVLTGLGPLIISVAVAIVAFRQWQTSQQSVQISSDVAKLTRMQHETNQIAVEVAIKKREDELFDRRLTVFNEWADIIAHAQTSKSMTFDKVVDFIEGSGPSARFLFDQVLSDDIIAAVGLLRSRHLIDEDSETLGRLSPKGLENFAKIADERGILARMAYHLEVFERQEGEKSVTSAVTVSPGPSAPKSTSAGCS